MNMLDKRDRSLAPNPSGTGSTDKITKYRWARPTSPGRFCLIHKNDLNIDDVYQRERVSEEAVRRIARDFDWSLFGVIKVAQRADGTMWVFEGGHRLRATFYRSDVTEIPCIVFEISDVATEARTFIAAARMSQAISSFDTFRASAVAQEPVAVRTAEILKELGLKVRKAANKPTEIKCIHTVQKFVAMNETLAKRVLEVCIMIANDAPIMSHVLSGIFTMANHFSSRDILTEYADFFDRITQHEIDKHIRQLSAETTMGGTVVSAKAVIIAMNKGKKTKKLVW